LPVEYDLFATVSLNLEAALPKKKAFFGDILRGDQPDDTLSPGRN
jgi:hypothetical protein